MRGSDLWSATTAVAQVDERFLIVVVPHSAASLGMRLKVDNVRGGLFASVLLHPGIESFIRRLTKTCLFPPSCIQSLVFRFASADAKVDHDDPVQASSLHFRRTGQILSPGVEVETCSCGA